MSVKTVLAAAALLALAMVSFLLWRAAQGLASGPSGPAAAELSAPVLAAGQESEPVDPSRLAGAERVEQPASAPSGPAMRAIDRERDLHGVVLDPEGRPIGGASLEVLRNEFCEQSTLDLERAYERSSVARGKSDERGGFAFPLPIGRAFDLEVEASGFARALLTHRHAGEYVEVRLERGASVFGRVLRRADGSAVAGARVALPRFGRGRFSATTRSLETVTDARGGYRFEDLSSGGYRLQVYPPEDATIWTKIELHSGQALEQDVLVDHGADLHGRVTNAKTGEPIAGAEICESWTFRKFVKSDWNGEFFYPGFPLEGFFELSVRAEGFGRTEYLVRESRQGDFPERIEIKLQPARRAFGRVVDRAGSPVGDAYVAAVAYELGNVSDLGLMDWQGTSSDAAGRFELVDLRSDMGHTLWVKKEGLGTVAYQFPAREREENPLDLGTIVLQPAATLRGEVVDEEGRGVADHRVSLKGWNSDRARWNGALAGYWLDTYLAKRGTRTDDLGRFSFGDLAAGDYTVEVALEGSNAPVRQSVTIPEGETVSGLKLVLPAGLVIEGDVVGPDGEPVPASVSFRPEGKGDYSGLRTDAQGHFLARGLVAGSYELTILPDSLWESHPAGTRWARSEWMNVAAGTRGIRVVAKRALPLAGVVLSNRNVPVQGARIFVSRGESMIYDGTKSDAEGRFEFWLAESERFDLEAHPPEEGEPWLARAKAEENESQVARVSGITPGGAEVTLILP